MKYINKLSFILILCWSLLASAQAAITHNRTFQSGSITAIDIRNRTLQTRDHLYKLAIGVKVHDPDDSRSPDIYNLEVRQRIRFKTRFNKKTKLEEITEIWIIRI